MNYKYEGKLNLTIVTEEMEKNQIVGDMDRVEIKMEYYELKNSKGVVYHKRPKKLIIIAEKDYPL